MNSSDGFMRSSILLLIANWAFRDDQITYAFPCSHLTRPTFHGRQQKTYARFHDPFLDPLPFISAFCEKSRFPWGSGVRPAISLLFLSSQDLISKAQDLEAVQSLFNTYCDPDGLMTKDDVQKVPLIADLLAAGDLLPEELDDVFEKAPKFPTTEVNPVERIDVDSFVQVYRDIDDLFEDDDELNDSERSSPEQLADTTAVGEVEEETTTSLDVESESSLDDELASIYESICDDNGLIGKQQLREWDEVARLMQDGLLGDDELNDLWALAAGEQQLLDLDGFLSFNVALDNLFDFDDDDMLHDDEEGDMEDIMDDLEEELAEEPKHVIANPPQPKMVSGDDLSPEALFTALANAETGYVGWEELKRWKELQEMLVEGDLLESELSDLFQQSSQKVSPVSETTKQLDLQAFVKLTVALDNLFEEIDDEEVTTTGGDETSVTAKDELLDTLAALERDDVLPCGLEATELEQREIRSLVDMVEGMPSNWLLQGTGRTIDAKAVSGTWELAYTSSSAMKFNKGLTGLGGSVPNGRFGRLQQKLMATKYLTDVEYKEHIVLTPASASFDVTVTGTWEVRSSVSLFTGAPSVVLQVVPDRVTYGPTSTRADHWKSLGPMNLLDISYLDEDLRIMRGNTSVDTIFIFRRIK